MNTIPLFMGILAICFGLLRFSIHSIEEGHIGVYFRGGALLTRTTDPGWHLKIPFLDHVEQVLVTIQTDKVTDIPCGTSGGVLIWIERVEVVNRLKREAVFDTIKNYTIHYDRIWIFDKIHHEINQFCSKHTLQEVYIDLFHTVDEKLMTALQESADVWAPGIEIISIRITKPKIPSAILHNYEQMEAEKTKLLVAVQAQKVAEKEAETEKKRATIQAEKVAAVSKINMEQQIMERESQKQMQEIEDEAMLHRHKAQADALFYERKMKADGNELLLSEPYLKLRLIDSIANTSKVYFGNGLHSMVVDFMEMLQNEIPKLSSQKP